MQDILLSLMAGLFVGILFSVLKLPIPAPPVLSGIMGIVGVWLGSVVYIEFIAKLF